MVTATDTIIADELHSHYARVAPLLHAAFGGMPIISASFPQGLGTKAYWHTKPLPLEPSALAWCLDKLNAVEFHSWFPAPGAHDRCDVAGIFLEAADEARLSTPQVRALRTSPSYNQAAMMLGHEIFDPEIGKAVLVDHAFIISGGEITKQARNWLGNKLDRDQRRSVIFMHRKDVLDLFAVTNAPLPARAMPQKSNDDLDDFIPF